MISSRIGFVIALMIALVTACQPTPSFSLTLDLATVELTQGDSAQVRVNLERLGGFTDAVVVTFKDLPIDIQVSPTTLTIDAAASSATALLTADATAEVASKTVTLEGLSGKVQSSTSLQLETVKPDPNAPDLFVKRLEWGQSILKSDLRLVSGKSAVLRAFVNATQAGISGVIVRATASVAGLTLGTLDLTAPTSVPITDSATDLASTYWGVLPADWIKAGLEVKLQVDAGRNLKESNEGNNLINLKPDVGSGNKLYLTMVPLIADGKPPMAFDAAAVAALKTGLMSYWPLSDIDIQVRAPYTVKSVGSDWAKVLSEVTALRSADQSKRYYYGYYAINGGIAWIGRGVGVGTLSLGVVAHELGHTFGQLHSPCGNPSGIDANYPHKDGKIGSWGIDPIKNTLIDPTKHTDVMGYCGSKWVSDYMYRKVQNFLETNVPSAGSTNIAATDLLLVNGTVKDGQISLEPMQRISGAATAPTSGSYNLRLETASGLKEVWFDLSKATHEDGSEKLIDHAQFSFTMPDPGNISKVSLSGYGVTGLQKSSSLTVARVQPVQPITVQRNGSSLTVKWDAKAYVSLAVAHIAPDDKRTTLALGLTSGIATLELGTLGAGQFEVSASDGLNGLKQRF